MPKARKTKAKIASDAAIDTSSIFFEDYSFCLMELDSTKIIFENLHRNRELIKDLKQARGCRNLNIYSSLLKGCSKSSLVKMHAWIEKLQRIAFMDHYLHEELEAEAPKLKLKGKQHTYTPKFTLYVTQDQILYCLLIQMVPETPESTAQRSLVYQQLDHCLRGVRFGEVFYNYATEDISQSLDRVIEASETPDKLVPQHESVEGALREIQNTAIWLQLHEIADRSASLLEQVSQLEQNQALLDFDRYQVALTTLEDLTEIGFATAKNARHKRDIGQLRQYKALLDIEEEKYEALNKDFDILRKLAHFGEPEQIIQHVERCYEKFLWLDQVVLNRQFQRLSGITMDLSHEQEKSIQFSLDNSAIIISNHYAQYNISKYLLNTLRYIIIEHIETPKERSLSQKSPVARLELIITDYAEHLEIMFRDDGIQFDLEGTVERAIEREIITDELGEWMLEQKPEKIYNLMLKPTFGPAVKPPPLTYYRPYLAMIAEDTVPLQSQMHFTYDDQGRNVIQLLIPKETNGIVYDPFTS